MDYGKLFFQLADLLMAVFGFDYMDGAMRMFRRRIDGVQFKGDVAQVD